MEGLLLIDIQNDYFPGGKMELFNSEAAGDKAIDAFVRKVDGLQDQIDELRDSVA